ncbi:hypothetical protein [Cellulosimicrobium sp. 72-3]|uniref:hypothetical protein n=1 Tax=Cellulosimicrobium sp. 72-3 TaxID=2731680 RepID=UPI00148ECF17|nr:hypothetical protein [Cellulosimicrobium sp. 72-3]
METLDAITAIVRAGKGQEARELIERAGRAAKASYDRIKSDTDYTPDARRRRMEEVYQGRRQALDQELTSLASRVGYDDRADVARAFGIAGLAGDPASLAISMRDAQDRAAKEESSDGLVDLVRRATRNGDEVLARAAAQRAMELRYDKPLHEFVETRPALDSIVEDIWNAQRRGVNRLQWTVQLSALKPPTIR